MNKTLEILTRAIKLARESSVNLEQAVAALDSFANALRGRQEQQEKELESLLKHRAELLCPFKVGDYIKGWDAFDEERIAQIIGIVSKDSAPLWSIVIEKDGAPYILRFIDPTKLSLAYVDNE